MATTAARALLDSVTFEGHVPSYLKPILIALCDAIDDATAPSLASLVDDDPSTGEGYEPSADQDVATKKYVDDAIAAID